MGARPIIERPSETKTPRRFARQKFESLVYADLGPENGGFPINISEDGMAFQGIRPLEKNQTICITFKLYGIDESVTAMAKIAWLTESRKGGALQFIDLPEESRRLINNWIMLQKQAGNPKQTPTATISHVEVKGLPFAPAVPLVADHGNSSAKTTTTVATPLPSSLVPTGKVAQTIKSKVTPKAKLKVKKSLSIQHSQGSADLKRSSRTPPPVTRDEKKRSWSRSYGLGLAASIAMMTLSAVILWQLRGVLLPYLVSENQAQTDVQSASAPTPAPPPEQPAVVEPASDPSIIEWPLSAPIANGQENLTTPAPPKVMTSAPSHPARNPTPPVPQIDHGTTSKVPVFFAGDMRPRVPAQLEQSVTVPPSLISENTNELPGAGTAWGKISSLEVKPPENSVSAPGSIEIISAPYPSIRVPAEWKGRSFRPGTNLQIGHLVSKIEPLYPQDALRQRIAGTAKVHVVIGRNGTVERAELIDGPSLLAEAALRAVQQWHYEPTILGGAAIEVEEDITVVFRIASPLPPGN
jgi:TonB family protein